MNLSEALGCFAMKNREEVADMKKLFMEGYECTVMPPLTHLSPLRLGGVGVCTSRKRGTRETEGGAERHEPKFLNERNRRQKMSQSFSVLQSLLPTLSFLPKVSREQVLSGSIDFIKWLEEETNRLENLKKLLLQDLATPASSHYTSRASSVNLTISNGVVFFVIRFWVKRGLLYNVFMVFEKYEAEVLVANVSVDDHQMVTLTVTVKVGNGTRIVEGIRKELQNL